MTRGTVVFHRHRRYWFPHDEDGQRSERDSRSVATLMASGGKSADFTTDDPEPIRSWRPCGWTAADEAEFQRKAVR